ncbi:MAG: hypothetical protein JWO69_573 [Thermoleophilia bacterium]|nr:hypothetical protein [Thermoleophilia bacterium]
MRTRTFIGLIILVIALMVASTPALLTPASRGIEVGLAQAGVPGFDQAAAAKDATATERTAPIDPIEDRLMLSGHVRVDNDLRDDFSETERAANHGGRLLGGAGRTRLPGELDTSSATDQPIEFQDGVLLDNAGCPVFRQGTDVAALWANADLRQRYEDRAANADDPADCRSVLAARRDAALDGAAASEWTLRGDRRDTAATLRGTSEQVAMTIAMGELYEEMFGEMATYTNIAKAAREETG